MWKCKESKITKKKKNVENKEKNSKSQHCLIVSLIINLQCSVGYKDRQVDQLNRIDNPEIDPNKYV